jgi:hypothetical protein
MRIERHFRDVVSVCTVDTRHLLALITKVRAYILRFIFALTILKISEAACGLRSDDTTRLKSAILTYFYEVPKNGSTFANDYDNFEVLVASDGKDLRGFQHMDTAVHLCPLRLKEQFEVDPL